MLFMLVCAFGSAWVGWELERTRREQVVVAEIEKLGGRVDYHRVKGPDWFARRFRKVSIVNFSLQTNVTDEGLVYLKKLTSLEYLNLWATQVTDAGLEQLEGLANLLQLYLMNTQITDTGLVHLKGLTNLEELVLDNTQVTDAGVEKLRQALPGCRISH